MVEDEREKGRVGEWATQTKLPRGGKLPFPHSPTLPFQPVRTALTEYQSGCWPGPSGRVRRRARLFLQARRGYWVIGSVPARPSGVSRPGHRARISSITRQVSSYTC